MAGYNVLNDELTRAVKQVVSQHLSSFLPRPKRGRRPRRGGGGDSSNATNTRFGIVREEAGASGRRSQGDGLYPGSYGKCQLLDETMVGLPPEPGMPLEQSLIEVASLHLVPCPVNAIVQLHSIRPIKPGLRWPTSQSQPNVDYAVVWAQLVHCTDELYGLGGHAPEKVLWIPTGGTNGDAIRWDGQGCA